MLNALIVVDLQPEFIVNDDTQSAYNKILKFVKSTKDYDKIIAVQFVRGNPHFPNLINYNFPLNPATLEFEYDKLIQKTGYGLPDKEYFNLSREYHYDIVGCETDACVMKIALDLFDREFSFNILYSYTFTGSNKSDKDLRDTLTRMFGKAVIFN